MISAGESRLETEHGGFLHSGLLYPVDMIGSTRIACKDKIVTALFSVTPAQAGAYVHSHSGKEIKNQLGTSLQCNRTSMLRKLVVMDSGLTPE